MQVRLYYRHGGMIPLYADFPIKRMFQLVLSEKGDIELLYTSHEIRIPFEKRMSNLPFYSEPHLVFENQGIWFSEFFPLLKKQKENLLKFFRDSDVDTYSPMIYSAKGKAENRMVRIKTSIEDLEKTGNGSILDNVILAIAQFIEENFHSSDYGKASYYIKFLLNSDGFQPSNGSFNLTYLSWLYRSLAIKRKQIPYLFGDSHLISSSDTYSYKIRINLSGLAAKVLFISAGGFKGTLEVVCDDWKKQHGSDTIKFDVYYVSLGGGVGLGIQTSLSLDGIGHSSVLWQPSDFKGSFTLNKAEFSIGIGPADAKTYIGDMNINSDKNLPDLNIKLGDLSKIKYKISGRKGVKLGAGAEVTLLGYGKITDLQSKVASSALLVPYGNYETEYNQAYTGKDQVHFKHDGAELSPGALNLIRRMCAVELPLFKDKNTKIRIEGHTDSTGTEEHNLLLATKRAENVKRAMKAIMGSELPQELDIIPIGEKQQASKGIDGTVNPKARRVDVLINGVVVLSLW